MGDTDFAPGWTRPKASFKLKRTGRGMSGAVSREIPVPSVGKRRNPFDPEGTGEVVENAAKKQRLGDIFSPASSFHQKSLPRPEWESSSSSGDSGLVSDLSSSSSPVPASLPLDWSLKSRLRVSCGGPGLGWAHHLSTVEEASGVTGGVRCLSLTSGRHCLQASVNAQFHSLCLYWQHPALPVPLFPRYTQSSRGPPAAAALPLSPDLQQSLHSDWMTSLQSVYQLVKARQCPYFYLLAPGFTVLFRAAGVAGSQEISALLGPSTSGLRAALKREEIEFTLPLFQAREAEESKEPEDDTANEFLESLGIEADSLPGLSNTALPKNRLAAGSGKSGDGAASSLVAVAGVECQSLLNFLLNAKLGTGRALLPPTLLAPVAYHGATLRRLRVRGGQVAGRAGQPAQHTVELTGPLLPHAVQGLARLAAVTSPSWQMALHTQEETASFSLAQPGSAAQPAPAAFATASLEDCGLDPEMLKVFCAPAGKEGEDQVIRDIAYRDGGFTINTQSNISN